MLNFLDGYKSRIAAALMMLTGAATILGAVASAGLSLLNGEHVTWESVTGAIAAGAAVFAKGLEAWGVAHKSEKLTDAVLDNTAAVVLASRAEVAAVKQAVEGKR